MTPSARLHAAAAVLDALPDHDGRADQALKAWGRANRYAGSKDRAMVGDWVYLALRRRRSLAWRSGAEDGRGLTLAAAYETGGMAAVEALFRGEKYGPPPLTAEERAALARPEAPPEAVALDWPDWLWEEAGRALGAARAAELALLRERAPLDLRANLLKTDRAGATAALAAEGIAALPAALSPWALRAPEGAKIARSRAFQDGLVEPQDCASQAAALHSAAAPGERVLDYCAGGGGKTLALAAMVGPHGRVDAHDIAPRRMADLPERARRAGAEGIIRLRPKAALGRYDLVFVDAPCTGSGAWRRNPDEKWCLTPARLKALHAAQAEALTAAAEHVRPGGRLVYATCSLLASENEDTVAAFLARTPAFAALGAARRFTPSMGGDGFFVAAMGADIV